MRASFVLGAAAKKPRGRPPRPTGRPPLPKAPVTFPRGTLRKTFSEDSINNLFDHVARSWPESSKAALAHFRQHLVKSVSAPDDEGRLASRNQRQVATVLAHDQNVQLGGNDYLTVKRLYARPSLSNVETARKLISFWRLDQLKDGVVILGNSGHPALLDEILSLPNIKRVIAIEESPEYLSMYSDERRAKYGERLKIVHEEAYWWTTYRDIEAQGLLSDVETCDFDEAHPSLFYACFLPDSDKSNRQSSGFFMQLLHCAVVRNWLFRYGRIRMGISLPKVVHDRLTTRVGSMHHSRSAAILDLVADFSSFNGGVPLPVTDFFPFSVLGASDNGYPTRNFKHRHHPTSAIPMHVVPKPGRILTSREFDALDYIMKSMFIFSGQPWTHGISHTAPNAAIMAEKLEAKGQGIPEPTVPRQITAEQWVNLARCYNEWPFKPRTYETDFEDRNAEVSQTLEGHAYAPPAEKDAVVEDEEEA